MWEKEELEMKLSNLNLQKTDLNLPKTDLNLPKTDSNLPKTDLNLPNTDVNDNVTHLAGLGAQESDLLYFLRKFLAAFPEILNKK